MYATYHVLWCRCPSPKWYYGECYQATHVDFSDNTPSCTKPLARIYITTMLWPFALKAAQDRLNQLNIDLDGKTPDMKFSGVASMALRLRDFHTFGCPCYILDSRLQTNQKGVPKWEPRARLG